MHFSYDFHCDTQPWGTVQFPQSRVITNQISQWGFFTISLIMLFGCSVPWNIKSTHLKGHSLTFLLVIMLVIFISALTIILKLVWLINLLSYKIKVQQVIIQNLRYSCCPIKMDRYVNIKLLVEKTSVEMKKISQ